MIKLLDCTLRDGGHINKSFFGRRAIHSIIKSLISSQVDIIELGFLKQQTYNPDISIFSCIEDCKNIIDTNDNVEYSLMYDPKDKYDISNLEPCDGTVKHIRVSFHNYDFDIGLNFAREVIKKGYKCHINPINLQGYNDKELIDIIAQVNDIKPNTFTIVDTFGAMTEKELNRIVAIIDNNLLPDISIGLHLHENLGLSFSLAQFFTKIKPIQRTISIDASMNGMGRIPGNLNIELIMDYMNRTYGANYNIAPVYDAIDNFILPIKKEIPWGYSLPYALSAQHGVHRTYAEYLISKYKLKTRDIQNILSSIDKKEKTVYNKKYIQTLYMQYLCKEFDDSEDKTKLKKIFKDNKILFLAPGKSIDLYKNKILDFIKSEKPLIVTVNFSAINVGIPANFSFFCNIRRFESVENYDGELIITSNLKDDIEKNEANYILNLKSLIFDTENEISDNALLLILKLANMFEMQEIYIAGFDGFKKGENYFDKMTAPLYDSMSSKYLENELIKTVINNYFNKINIMSLTPSLYVEDKFCTIQ